MDCPKRRVFSSPIFFYFYSIEELILLALLLEGVLQQVVNCILEAYVGSHTLRQTCYFSQKNCLIGLE